jgi:WD40 repeat protein
LRLIVLDRTIENIIPSHGTEIQAIAVNPDGTLICSTSEKGTIIRVFSAEGGELLQELR